MKYKALLLILTLRLAAYGQDTADSTQRLPAYFVAGTGTFGRALFDIEHTMVGFEPHRGVNLKLGRYTHGRSSWSRQLNKPYYGVGFHYSAYGQESIYGYPRAGYAFVGIPLWRLGKWQCLLDGGVGLAWGFHPHHPETNPDNLAISSRVNGFFNANGLFEYPLGRGFDLAMGLGFTHYSNSITRYPNLGVNLLHGVVSIKKNFAYRDASRFRPIAQADSLGPKPGQWGLYVALTGGVKQIVVLGDIYRVHSAYADVFYQYGALGRATGGVDYFYDPSRMYPVWYPPQGPHASHRIGVHVGHDFLINRVNLTTQVGLFVYEGHNTEEYFFFRLGGKIALTEHLYANATLMTFWINASMLELGLGFQLF